jgi:hypothetical protein
LEKILCRLFAIVLGASSLMGFVGTESWADSNASQYTMEYNTNRSGEDYKDLDLNAPDPALCANACMSEARCMAWTYVKPGVQGDNAKCWLKERVPHPTPDDNCVSGVGKNRGGDGISSRQYTMEYNTNRAGEDYQDLDLNTPDPELCANACMNEARCRAWTYVKPGVQGDNAKCWLKERVPHPSPDENCVSGVNEKR